MTRNSLTSCLLFFGFALAAGGCDPTPESGVDDDKKAAGGSGTGGNASGGNASGGEGGSGPDSGIPIPQLDGWVDATTNELGIVGALYSASDAASGVGLMEDFSEGPACISGTAAQVDTGCIFEPPAKDCYGQFWGALVALNLNQQIDPATDMGGEPAAFDASSLRGFAFTISGDVVPSSLRFKVKDANGEYCNPSSKAVSEGRNEVMFTDLLSECWNAKGTQPDTSVLISIGWQVVTNAMATVPFDFCVSELEALPFGGEAPPK